VKEKIALLISAMGDKRTPWYAKAIVVLTLAYIISPIDIIPDFIPVIGLLDEIILIPVTYNIVVKLIPESVKEDALIKASENKEFYSIKLLGLILVLVVWFVLIFIHYKLLIENQ
jgi:uncharacterized membrane protein YkvA (DUF1232 family)